MPCKPADLTINPDTIPGISIPGLGIPTVPFNIPIDGLELPTELLEDLFALIEQIKAIFPSGDFLANIDTSMKDLMDIISNILSQIAPFLSFYNFIMAALKLIICIIEVLCAIPNPIALAFAMKKLFMECLPPFLKLFPWLALIIMIISLLLLILALILYIIGAIIALILDIIKNILALERAITDKNTDAALAIAMKLASLFCIMQNILAILIAIAAIIAIIQSLAAFAGGTICGDEDAEGCCPPENCPDFIKNNPDGISADTGELVYFSQVGADVGALPPPLNIITFPPLREERWQLFDPVLQEYPFRDIITPVITTNFLYLGKIFYPQQSFEADVPLGKAPYLVDIRLFIDPGEFNTLDVGGSRFMRVNNCAVIRKPYLGVLDKDNNLIPAPNTGTLNIEGGLVFEDDDSTPYLVDGEQATLNTFIHEDLIPTNPPVYTDGYEISNIEYTLKPNHGPLMEYNLITLGCMPTVLLEKATVNARATAEGFDSIVDRLEPTPDGDFCPSAGFMPNVECVLECIIDALDKFKQDVSATGAAEFQAKFELCMGDLQNQTLAAYCEALTKGVSQFESTVELDTDVQFTTRSIEVTVVLKDPTGTSLSANIHPSCDLSDKLQGEVTFGEVSDFTYDGYTAFNAYITSEETGSGILTVLYDNNVLSKVVIGDDDNPATIVELALPYNFVDDLKTPAPRRDETDVSRDGS